MTANYHAWAEQVRRLHRALAELNAQTRQLGLTSAAGEEWFAAIEHKLLPQLELPPLLVVAVVGGTNIGKSVLFNHLAGATASAASPLAAGTKHPVCLAPANLDGAATLNPDVRYAPPLHTGQTS